jgi:D-alanine transaminase
MKKELIFIDSKFVAADKAKVSVLDRGLNYGDGLFETMKASNGRVLFLKEHMERMKKGARSLSISSKPLTGISKDGGVIQELIKKNGLLVGSSCVKITLTRGVGGEAHLPKRGNTPTLIITAKPVTQKEIKRLQSRGANAITVESQLRTNAHIKNLNFLPSVLAKMEAKKKRAYEAILTYKGNILEASASNIFIVRGSTLITPPDDGSILPGITRGVVLRLATASGLKVKTVQVKRAALQGASEAFLTNSIIEIVPLVKVDSSQVGSGRPGTLTRRLQKLYREETA